MMTHKVLNIEPLNYSVKARNDISTFAEYKEGTWGNIQDNDCDILIVRLARKIDTNILDRFPNLKVIISATTGTNHLDMEALKERDIKLICLKGENDFLNTITSTPELTWGLVLSIVRNIPQAYNSVRHGDWNRDMFVGSQLNGKNIGIIGLGRTGSKIAQYAKAFGMNVFYYDPYVINGEYNKISSVGELLRYSDIVSIHVHLYEETYRMINMENLCNLKHGAFIINSSRGDIIDEEAAMYYLNSGIIKGIAVDVLSTELSDIKDSLLFKAMQDGKNIIITPHIGGASEDAMKMCEEFVASRLKEYLKIIE